MQTTTVAAIIFFLLLAWVAISIIYWSIKNGISPMPSSRRAKKAILMSIPKDVSGEIFELGCGWGTLAFDLAAKFPHVQIEAYETSTIPYLYCITQKWLFPVPNLHFHRKDFYKASLHNAGAVVCYLYPGAMQKLKPKFEHELPLHSTIVTNTFSIHGWNPSQSIDLLDMYRTQIFVYRIKK